MPDPMLALWPALPGIVAPRPIALRTTAIATTTTTTTEPHIGKPGSMGLNQLCALRQTQPVATGMAGSILEWARNAAILADGTAWDINGARLVAS